MSTRPAQRMLPRLLAVAVLLSPSLLFAQGNKVALVVGINRYRHSELNRPAPLEYAEADARELADELKKSGYEVVVLLGREATLRAIRDQLEALRKKPEDGGVFLVALAGHGVQPQSSGEAYYCPFDADQRIVRPGDANRDPWDYATMLPLTEVVSTFRASSASNRMLLVDACRNDPASGRGRGVGTGLQVGSFPKNTAVLLSCSEGERSFEHREWGHGAFFHQVLRGLRSEARDRRERVTADSLWAHVSDTVPGEVGRVIAGGAEQTPFRLISGRVDLQIEAGGGALPKEIVVDLGGGVKLELVRIPKGTFTMGSPESEKGRDSDEHQHEVEITQDFYMGKFEVTQEQYEKLMGTNPSYFSPAGGGKDRVAGLDTGKFPVEMVSWHDAVKFCEKLTGLPGERAAGRTYRLPTEAEWEYSCRGGATSYQVFSFGDSLSSDQANFDGNHPYGSASKSRYLDRTTTIGSYKPNGFGLFDMHGNVWEWCSDWYDENYYKTSPRKDPAGPTTGTTRVLRGGSWVNLGRNCRSANRFYDVPDVRGSYLGFRVVCVPRRTR